MTSETNVMYRGGVGADAAQVAGLHAASWRHHYRGAYSDEYLDRDVFSDRLKVWIARMARPPAGQFTIVAESDGQMVGFVHTVLGADPLWGALIDNLHVTYELKRHRVGSNLLQMAARTIIERRPSSGMYLWVLEQNGAAQRFYEARGGRSVDRDLVAPPGGDPARLNGTPTKLRYAWSDPMVATSQ
jgi:ribosomal protein S18 acetylase RimI-like enzyme